MNSIFIRHDDMGAQMHKLRKGVIISSHTGKAATYGLVAAHDKGPVLIGPQTPVYAGMVVGINGRDEDLEVNVTREKQLTNNRSSGEDGIFLPATLEMSLEQKLGFLEDDELLEITPDNLRLRKKILDANLRRRAQRSAKA